MTLFKEKNGRSVRTTKLDKHFADVTNIYSSDIHHIETMVGGMFMLLY